MALQTENDNRNTIQQAGVVAGGAAVMFVAAGTTEGLFSTVMLAAGVVTILGALALFASVYLEEED